MHIILRSLWQRHLPLARRASTNNSSIFARATPQCYGTSAESPRTRSGKLWGVWGVLAVHARLTRRKSGLLGPCEQHARLYARGAYEAFRIALDSYISWCIKVGFGQIISVGNPKFRCTRVPYPYMFIPPDPFKIEKGSGGGRGRPGYPSEVEIPVITRNHFSETTGIPSS